MPAGIGENGLVVDGKGTPLPTRLIEVIITLPGRQRVTIKDDNGIAFGQGEEGMFEVRADEVKIEDLNSGSREGGGFWQKIQSFWKRSKER